MGFLALFALKRQDRRPLGYAFSIAFLTVLHAVFLFYVSKTELHFVCLWCMRMYAVNLSSFVLIWLAARGSPLTLIGSTLADLIRWPTAMRAAAGIFVAVLSVGIIVQKSERASLNGAAGPEPEVVASDKVTKVGGDKILVDQKGEIPVSSWTVKTEDNNERELTLRPDDIWKGNPNAKVVLVEFADFECGFCKRFSSELERLYEAYGDRILFVFRFYAMDPACNPGVTHRLHRHACAASQSGICARRQGKFWAFHDMAFKNQHKLDLDALREYARVVGLDMEQFNACMRDPSSRALVHTYGEDGKTLDIHGTPRLYINGVRYRGPRTAEAVAREVERLLGSAPSDAREAAKSLRNVAKAYPPIPDDVPSTRAVHYGSLKFEIDTFEDAIKDGKAVSGKGNVPAYRVSWFEAQKACQAAGKRLCTEREWLAVCQGALPVDDDHDGSYADDMIEGTAYPYSDFHQIGACWDGHYRDDTKRPVYTGSFPGCISKDGVYDLTGNMEEWVGDSAQHALLMGGAYDTREDKARCYRPNDTFGPGYAAVRTGFRCCRTLP
jgi:protein-disulfide isomerase